MANQLTNLFRERGFEAYIVLPRETCAADWLINPAPVINISRFKELCRPEDILIENWYESEIIAATTASKAAVKIYYPQASTFYKSEKLLGDELLRRDFGYTHFWAVSNPSMQVLQRQYPRIRKWYLVHPYFEFEKARAVMADVLRNDAILAFPRKGRLYIHPIRFRYGKKIRLRLVDKFTEKEAYLLYASHKYFLATATGVTSQTFRNLIRLFRYGNGSRNLYVVPNHGHREGFPLPPAEAAMCGTIVIGFAMGGGLDWMSPSTCFLAEDRSYRSLSQKVREALSSSEETLQEMRKNAFRAVARFSKENTWRQIQCFFQQELP